MTKKEKDILKLLSNAGKPLDEAASKEEKQAWKIQKTKIIDFLKKYDLIVEVEPKQMPNVEFEVRAKKGSEHRIKVRDKLFTKLPPELKKWNPKKGWGGKKRSKKAPNIEFDNGWRIVWAPTEGEKEIRPEDYEDAICAMWNEKHDYSYNFDYNQMIEDQAIAIVDRLENKIRATAKAQPYGRVIMPDVSDFWHEHTNRPDRTPKTDLIIGDYKISLKMGEKTQLASPKVVNAEGEALFFHAVERSNLEDEIVQKFRDWFTFDEEGISKLGASTKEIVAKGEEYFKANQRELTKDIKEIIKNNKEFAFHFVEETMSGDRKFENVGGAEEGVAEYVLVCEYDGSAIVMHDISKSYVNKIADQVEIYVAWKSAGGSKYATFRVAQTTKLSERMNMADVINNASNDELGEINLKLEDILEYAKEIGAIEYYDLNEGLKDVIKTIGDTLKKIVKKGVDKLLDLFGVEIDKVEVKGVEHISFW
jgi:hypothetical protein